MTSGFWDVSRHPKNQLFLSLGTPGYLTTIKKKHNSLNISYFYKSQHFGKPFFVNFQKDGHRKRMKIRLKSLGNLVYEISIYQETRNGCLTNW